MSAMTRLRLPPSRPRCSSRSPRRRASNRRRSGFNSNAPVDVEADRIEVQDRADRAIFSGNVVARQGNMTMSAARLTVAYTDTSGDRRRSGSRRAAASPCARPSETARGQFAIYDVNRRIVTMIGGVHLTQGQNRVQGGRLVLDLNSQPRGDGRRRAPTRPGQRPLHRAAAPGRIRRPASDPAVAGDDSSRIIPPCIKLAS